MLSRERSTAKLGGCLRLASARASKVGRCFAFDLDIIHFEEDCIEAAKIIKSFFCVRAIQLLMNASSMGLAERFDPCAGVRGPGTRGANPTSHGSRNSRSPCLIGERRRRQSLNYSMAMPYWLRLPHSSIVHLWVALPWLAPIATHCARGEPSSRVCRSYSSSGPKWADGPGR